MRPPVRSSGQEMRRGAGTETTAAVRDTAVPLTFHALVHDVVELRLDARTRADEVLQCAGPAATRFLVRILRSRGLPRDLILIVGIGPAGSGRRRTRSAAANRVRITLGLVLSIAVPSVDALHLVDRERALRVRRGGPERFTTRRTAARPTDVNAVDLEETAIDRSVAVLVRSPLVKAR